MDREKAWRKQARTEWQLKKYSADDCNVQAVNGVLDTDLQEDQHDEAINVSTRTRTQMCLRT